MKGVWRTRKDSNLPPRFVVNEPSMIERDLCGTRVSGDGCHRPTGGAAGTSGQLPGCIQPRKLNRRGRQRLRKLKILSKSSYHEEARLLRQRAYKHLKHSNVCPATAGLRVQQRQLAAVGQ